MSSTDSAHILVFPYPAQGHMLALLDLTHQLAIRGLTITVVVTPKNLPILNPLLSQHPSIQTLVLPLPPHPSIPPGVENVKDLGNQGNFAIMSALGALYHPIAHWFNSHPSPPVAILSDFFLGWTHHLALHLAVPRIVFYSSGAFLVSVLNYIWHNLRTVRTLSSVAAFPDLPNSPSFPSDHLPSVFRRYRESEPDSEFMKNGMIANISSWGCVFNTLDDLEGNYLDHFRKEMGHSRVWAVGPLCGLDSGAGPAERGGPSAVLASDVMTWLDGCPDESVVYVCFGSQVLLTGPQMEALAAGLERSGTRFIWVVKVADGYGVVPDGFEDRVGGRGMVIRGWAAQVPILSHGAVGGFLSHCGWNSVLEGIVAGVMLLAWPMEADQFVNARLMVEEMGAAVRVCEGRDTVPDSAELARTIADSMGGTRPEKVQAKVIHEKALASVREGGSSLRDLDGLVKELHGLHGRRVTGG
ncbi:hypothetical protein HHK36_015090 [Tetracentron sinense]|uniref:Glycosyltransferase n=1 Tax=Tetracentron sinense TaxID=13715 RepID=A0A834Z4F9_TETSI|nr:hypothetical protein HHK36_015090 [Tetracentron sinense]